MQRFAIAIENAVRQQNWYAALALSLCMPDVCGGLEWPELGRGRQRYYRWYDQYMLLKYAFPWEGHVTEKTTVMLSAQNCFALRCSYLHQGSDDITEQEVRETLDRFAFSFPREPGRELHCNRIQGVLQLQVDIFCRDMVEGVLFWTAHVSDNLEVQRRMQNLLTIYDMSGGFGIGDNDAAGGTSIIPVR